MTDIRAKAEAIVRNHTEFCVGHHVDDQPWCSTVEAPLCRGCTKLANAIEAALTSQGAGNPQGDLRRAIQFGQMRGAWTSDQAWMAWEEQEARIARAQMEPVKHNGRITP